MSAIASIAHRLHDQEIKLLQQLREARRRSVQEKPKQQLTFGERLADGVAATMGSWSFIII